MNIILQHWSGDINELTELSVASMSRYAEKVGAEHRLLRGDVFHPTLSAPCQKMYMLDKEFDSYDIVVMVDCDMFTRKGMTDNVFTDVVGIGRHTAIQDKLQYKLKAKHPDLASMDHPYWGGSIYRTGSELRQTLRAGMVESEMLQYSDNFVDEGIMNRLATLANIKVGSDTYLPGNHWNRGNFEPKVECAALIHIRRKIKQGIPATKMAAYADMVDRGLIE